MNFVPMLLVWLARLAALLFAPPLTWFGLPSSYDSCSRSMSLPEVSGRELPPYEPDVLWP